VADVGDVHHVPHRVAVQHEHALQQVLEQVRAQVADVLEVVDGRPARVEADLVAGERPEFAEPAFEVVVKKQWHRVQQSKSRRITAAASAESTQASRPGSSRKGGEESIVYNPRLCPKCPV